MDMRSFGRLGAVCLFTATMCAAAAGAATDPMAGTWKMNPAKSKLTDEMKVTEAGPNTYMLNFSGDNTETIVANGTDQPGLFGSTFAITVLSPHRWKMVRKTGGTVTISAIWELSDDGNTLTDHFTGYRADGSTTDLLYKYTRIDGGSGFAGTWESTEEQVNSSFEMQIETYAGDGLSFINPAQKMTKNIKFDGKDYTAEGPNLPAGYATSGRRLSAQSVELTDKINGKVLDMQQVEVAPDGKSLTITTQIPGRRKPNIQVFERE
ncbi:hypothetical protein [Occallatibacter riparius]|uniref:Lipocalin-like domain-containing protein n=1 Tax=Occallatibacter riparius TaxID=1002689 RepID=A0A9J7BU16_9BACT|nr:hypothetical protein [Occallatibacter riparius]UWZ86372.1 hypothetical protein MOP44_10610 [Occallatibacter riparius]